MFKITTNFDSRKFAKDLEKQAIDNIEKQLRAKLRDLITQGLKVSVRKSIGSNLSIDMEGPEALIETAKKRLN
jgi:hypothetical protein